VPSGLPTDSFSFVGFPPPKAQAREGWLRNLAGRRETLVFFEAPHRIRMTLEAVLAVLGDRQISVGRELTKLHEETVRGSVSAVLAKLTQARGEFTVVLAGSVDEPAAAISLPAADQLLLDFGRLTDTVGLSRRAAISSLAGRYGMPSRELYRLIEAAKNEHA
jgi:16S rRNA (cytidine1402-2'-O)-methyltransferase